MTTLRFTSWVQPATGAAVGTVDPADAQPDNPASPAARPSLAPVARVVESPGGGAVEAGGPALEVLGASAVVGLQAGEVIGRFPVPGAVGSDAVNLAAVEFAATDMPWRFSPARAGSADRLRPWLVLVVVPAGTQVIGGVQSARMSVEVAELPDLAESWAWAHAQLDGDGSDPQRGRSRLLCPRKLPPNTRLVAAVVPSFRGGVQAGLGIGVDVDRANEPAWQVDQPGPVTLPVYEHWEFTTGQDADFEALARRIEPAKPSQLEGFGYRMVDIAAPWTGDDPLPGGTAIVALGGALRPIAEPPAEFVTAEQIGEFHRRIVADIAASADGDLGPPLRGGNHVRRSTIAADGGDWLDQVNRDAVRRLAGGRGADWVMANQEALMAKAWLQAGEIREAARRLAMGRASVAITESLQRRHLDRLTGDELIAVTAPAAARSRIDGSAAQPTLRAVLDASAAPAGLTATPLARLTRRAGVVGRASGSTRIVTRAAAGALADVAGSPDRTPKLAVGGALPAMPEATIAKQLTARQDATSITAVATAATSLWVASRVAAHQGVAQPVRLPAAVGDLTVLRAGPDVLTARLRPAEVRSAVVAAIGHDRLGPAALPLGAAAVTTPAVSIHADGLRFAADVVAAVVRASVDSSSAVRRRVASTLAGGSRDASSAANLDAVLQTPDVPAPMAMALVERDPEWFLPGLGAFPADRATLLTPDDRFIESVMVGANVELLAEFLWREFPTDRRGTPIPRFWPRPGGDVDIAPIHTWTGDLGSHMLIDGEATSVLLVRAELFRRYPATVVLAAPAEVDPAHPDGLRPVGAMADWRAPLFTVPVDPSTRAIGFEVPPALLTAPVSAAAPGWFFVMIEPPTNIRFGFDLGAGAADPPPIATWNEVTWDHVIDGRGFASARRPVAQPAEQPPDTGVWGGQQACAADVARICLQRPVRVALHASRMVG